MLCDNLLLVVFNVSDEVFFDMLCCVGFENLFEDSGFNSWFGEGGCLLFGGEFCCLVIVCVLLYDVLLMLLDEFIEGLDVIIESEMLELFVDVMCEKIVLMVMYCLCGLVCFD